MSKSVVLVLLGIAVASGAYAKDGYWHSHVADPRAFDSVSNSTVVAAPEIDPASALSGLTLLVGGIAVVRGRRK
jgi:hypothetical protein